MNLNLNNWRRLDAYFDQLEGWHFNMKTWLENTSGSYNTELEPVKAKADEKYACNAIGCLFGHAALCFAQDDIPSSVRSFFKDEEPVYNVREVATWGLGLASYNEGYVYRGSWFDSGDHDLEEFGIELERQIGDPYDDGEGLYLRGDYGLREARSYVKAVIETGKVHLVGNSLDGWKVLERA